MIQYVGKEKALQILTNIIDIYNSHSLFVHTSFFNSTNPNERMLNFTSQSSQSTSLYNLMEIDGDMALSLVKEQLIHFRIKKVIEEHCKDSIT